MPTGDAVQIILLIVLVVAAAKPVGVFLHRVFSGERTFLHPVLGPLERLIYRAIGVDPAGEMTWVAYSVAVIVFTFVCTTLLYVLLRVQGWLPLNPAHAPNMSPLIAVNTAISFVTNEMAVFTASKAGMFAACAGLSGSHPCTRSSTYSSVAHTNVNTRTATAYATQVISPPGSTPTARYVNRSNGPRTG